MSPDLGAQTHNFGPQVSYQGVQRADRFGQLLYLLVHESQVLCSFFAQVLCSTQPDEVGTRAKQYSPEQDELCIAVSYALQCVRKGIIYERVALE